MRHTSASGAIWSDPVVTLGGVVRGKARSPATVSILAYGNEPSRCHGVAWIELRSASQVVQGVTYLDLDPRRLEQTADSVVEMRLPEFAPIARGSGLGSGDGLQRTDPLGVGIVLLRQYCGRQHPDRRVLVLQSPPQGRRQRRIIALGYETERIEFLELPSLDDDVQQGADGVRVLKPHAAVQ